MGLVEDLESPGVSGTNLLAELKKQLLRTWVEQGRSGKLWEWAPLPMEKKIKATAVQVAHFQGSKSEIGIHSSIIIIFFKKQLRAPDFTPFPSFSLQTLVYLICIFW